MRKAQSPSASRIHSRCCTGKIYPRTKLAYSCMFLRIYPGVLVWFLLQHLSFAFRCMVVGQGPDKRLLKCMQAPGLLVPSMQDCQQLPRQIDALVSLSLLEGSIALIKVPSKRLSPSQGVSNTMTSSNKGLQPTIVIVTILTPCISAVFVALRIYTRYFVTNTLSWEDSLIVVPMVCRASPSGCPDTE